jgi:hypothetical protein
MRQYWVYHVYVIRTFYHRQDVGDNRADNLGSTRLELNRARADEHSK